MVRTTNTFSIRIINPTLVSRAKIASFKAPTNIVFSTSTGLSFSNKVVDILVDLKRIYVLSNQKISILDRDTNTVIGFIEKPKPNIKFLNMTPGRSVIYVGTTFGVYAFPKDRNEENQNHYLKLLHHPANIGGSQIHNLFWRAIREANFLLLSHENGLTIVYNELNYSRKLVVVDSNPGAVYMSSTGRVYYQHGSNGYYVVRDLPPAQTIAVTLPDLGYIFSTSSSPSIASNSFVGLAVTENSSILGSANTSFLATTSGVSVLSESPDRFALSSVKNISLSNIVDIKVTDGANATSGKIFYVTSAGVFGTYDLSTDSVVNSVSSSNEELLPSAGITVIEEI